MISDLKFKILKNILLKNFTDTTVMIIVNGSIQTKMLITNSKITICKNKIIISNEEKDFTIDFIVMKKIVLDDEYRIKIIFEDFEIILEIYGGIMKKEQIEEIINILSKNFKNKEIDIIFDGAIEFVLKMKNIKFFVTRDIIIIVDENDKEFRIDPFYIDDIEFKNNTIKFEKEGYYTVQFDN